MYKKLGHATKILIQRALQLVPDKRVTCGKLMDNNRDGGILR